MGYYLFPPKGSGGGGITTYATFSLFPATAPDGTVALALDTDILYAFNTGSMSWIEIGGPGVALSIGTIDSTAPSANGAVISANSLIMQSASATVPGLVNNTTQTLSGVKTFSSAPNFSSLTASTALVLDGSKNVASLAYSATGGTSNLVSRDANGNSAANNFISATTSTTAAGGTTVLTVGSTRLQQLVGTTTQTYQLPDATTLIVGTTFEFNNNSTAGAFVVNAGSGAVATLLPGSAARIICTVNGFPNGVWDVHWYAPSNAAWGTASLTVTGDLRATGILGVGTTSPTNIISISGQAAQTIWMERNTTANTAGNNLTLQASGATTGATDKNGGTLFLSGGTSTGTGTSQVQILTSSAGSTGTSDNVPTVKIAVTDSGTIGINTASPITTLDIRQNNLGGSPTNLNGISLNGYENGTGITSPNLSQFAFRGTQASPTNILSGDFLGSVRAGGYYTGMANPYGTSSDVNSAISWIADEDFVSSTNRGTRLTFSSTPVGSGTRATRLTIASTGFIGIGVTVPTSLLHTVDSAAKTASYTGVLHTVSNTSSTASINKIGLSVQSTGTWNGTSAVNTGLVVNATGGTTNYAATFSGGNVGIGNTTPTATLHVTGTILASSTITGSNLSGTNTGDVTLGTANGLTLAGQVLSLTSTAVATANGFAGTNSGGASPTITLTTSVTGLLTGNGTAISALSGAKGSIVAGTGVNTYSSLAVGTNNQYLIADSSQTTGLNWTSNTNANLTVTSQTTTYAILTTDSVVLCSGSAFTATLPTAVGVSGKQYTIEKTDSSFTNIITVGTTSSQTIGAGGGTTFTLNTQGESISVYSDGSNWQIQNHVIPSVWTTFTCTPTGTTSNPTFGTIVTNVAKYKRIGDSIEIFYTFQQSTAGTAGSGAYLFPLPSGLTADTGKITLATTQATASVLNTGATICGIGNMASTTGVNTPYAPFLSASLYNSSNITLTIYNTNAAVAQEAFVFGSGATPIFNSNPFYLSFKALVPISGWNG